VTRIPLHHEWHGDPDSPNPPLLLVHGGGSTIASNWGMLLPLVAPTRSVLAVELQGHGRTAAGDRPPSFEASADDVAEVLRGLGLGPVDVLGFSNGGQVALQLAARHPEAVRRVIAASAPVRRDGMVDGFWEGLERGTFDDLPAPYRVADLAVSHDPEHARRMFELDRALMLGFRDFSDELLASISAPVLVVGADRDVIRAEHFVLQASLLPDARLLIVPGTHGDYLGEVLAAAGDRRALERTLPLLLAFLEAPDA
jgi:pimeloyl-ACP methyl ester carboxylesterase